MNREFRKSQTVYGLESAHRAESVVVKKISRVFSDGSFYVATYNGSIYNKDGKLSDRCCCFAPAFVFNDRKLFEEYKKRVLLIAFINDWFSSVGSYNKLTTDELESLESLIESKDGKGVDDR